jgi:hypothetical protein
MTRPTTDTITAGLEAARSGIQEVVASLSDQVPTERLRNDVLPRVRAEAAEAAEVAEVISDVARSAGGALASAGDAAASLGSDIGPVQSGSRRHGGGRNRESRRSSHGLLKLTVVTVMVGLALALLWRQYGRQPPLALDDDDTDDDSAGDPRFGTG